MALSSLSVVGNANRLRGHHIAPLPSAATNADTSAAPATVTPRVETRQPHEHHEHGGGEAAGSVPDPVCGMRIAPESAADRRQSAAGTLYFCSAHCAATYDGDPARYGPTARAGGES